MDARTMKNERIQACGSYDALTEEYSFTVSSGGLSVTFDFLSEEDIEELISCLACMFPETK
ncbi:MAG: hypothetical protein ACO4CH_12430 [Saprospiraceae bacterium]